MKVLHDSAAKPFLQPTHNIFLTHTHVLSLPASSSNCFGIVKFNFILCRLVVYGWYFCLAAFLGFTFFMCGKEGNLESKVGIWMNLYDLFILSFLYFWVGVAS